MTLIISAILTKIKAYILNKGRLIVEYILIIAVVALGSMCLNLYLADKEAKRYLENLSNVVSDQNVRLNRLNDANVAQANTINQLKELRSKDADAIGGLITDFKILADTNTKVDKRLKDLEANNEVVRKYLQSDIPAPLICLLNNTCSAETGSHK